MSRPANGVGSAVRDDALAICEIYNAALAERSSTFETAPRSPADFRSRIEDPRFPLLVVCDADKDIAGWAGLASYSARECYAGIGEASVYVAPRARGHGLGTTLTEALIRAAAESGFHKIVGKLFTDNLASVRMVERCGFDSVGLHRRHGQLDGIWRDVLVVERLLADGLRTGHTPSAPVIGLDHVQVAAPAGSEGDARRFFGGLLGLGELQKPEALRGRGGVWFACGAQQVHVGVTDDFAPAAKAHPALRVRQADLDPVAERLLAAGSTVRWDDAIPGTRRFYTADPWGNRIELLAAG